MKHGFLPILGMHSPGLYLIITHSRNKSIGHCGFGTMPLFAENRPKITYFWIQSNPAINKSKAHKPSLYSDVVWLSLYAQRKFHMDLSFPSIKLSGMKFLSHSFQTKTGGVHGCDNSKFQFLQQVIYASTLCCDQLMVLFSN